MKKVMKTIGAFMFASVMLTSCGSSIEADAKEVAELMCQSKKMSEKALSGDLSGVSESQEMMMKAEKIQEKFDAKYKGSESKKQFEEAVAKAILESNCN
jgi:hypothetical protein